DVLGHVGVGGHGEALAHQAAELVAIAAAVEERPQKGADAREQEDAVELRDVGARGHEHGLAADVAGDDARSNARARHHHGWWYHTAPAFTSRRVASSRRRFSGLRRRVWPCSWSKNRCCCGRYRCRWACARSIRRARRGSAAWARRRLRR